DTCRQDPAHQRNEVFRITRIRVACLLFLHDRHRDFRQVVEHQVVDWSTFNLADGCVRKISPEPLSGCNSYFLFHQEFWNLPDAAQKHKKHQGNNPCVPFVLYVVCLISRLRSGGWSWSRSRTRSGTRTRTWTRHRLTWRWHRRRHGSRLRLRTRIGYRSRLRRWTRGRTRRGRRSLTRHRALRTRHRTRALSRNRAWRRSSRSSRIAHLSTSRRGHRLISSVSRDIPRRHE